MTEPAISIVFSSYNGAARLQRMLDSLVCQTLSKDLWEVIAVDNNSSDDTFSTLEKYRDRLPIVPLRHPVPGKSRALNAAIDHARGSLLVFTDDDIEADPDWLDQLLRCAETQLNFSIFGGRILPDWERKPEGEAFLQWIPLGSTFAIIDESVSGPCDHTKIWGPNTAIRRTVMGDIRYREDIGPLPGGRFAMGEDQEIVMRLAARGARTYRCAQALVHHWIPTSSVSEKWVQQRGERLGYGVPALFPSDIPSGPRIHRVPLKTWLESLQWILRAAMLYPLPSSRQRFWAIWKCYYMRGYRAGIRRYGPVIAREG